MNKWFTTPATTPCKMLPSEVFVCWVKDNYRSAPDYWAVKFLEIGSGTGPDLRFLETLGFHALGLDSAPEAYAAYHEDVSYIANFKEQFDCIYELNVLCCVKNPPYQEIATALKPGGKFFAIMPAEDTQADFTGLEQQGIHVRKYSVSDIGAALRGIFSKIGVSPYSYPAHGRQYINWVVEACKG